MMIRPLRQCGARLLLTLFALFWGESVVLGSCPMHHQRAPQANHAMDHHQGHSGNPTQSEACKCLGDCVGGTAIAVAFGPAGAVGDVVPTGDAPVMVASTEANGRMQHRLPWAQGPPADLIS